ncbi:MAG: hypothetical protein ACRCYY_18035 [Trueperaceae bacterium]
MLQDLQIFLKRKQLSEGQAANVLRTVYALTFVAQSFVAALLTTLMLVVAGRQDSGVLLPQILCVLAVAQLPLALLFSFGVSRTGGRQAALSASIMSGVLLSTPAWFAAMTFLVSRTFFYLAVLLAILMVYYVLGMLLCGRWAKVALVLPSE